MGTNRVRSFLFSVCCRVSAEKYAFVTRQSLKDLGTVRIQNLVYSNCSVTLIGTMTFTSMGTSAALVVAVISRGHDISVFGRFCTLSPEFQPSSVGTGIFVLLRIVSHVFYGIRIGFVRALFADLVVRRLDKAFLTVFL